MELIKGLKFIYVNGDYKEVTLNNKINIGNKEFYTIEEGNTIFQEDELINILSRQEEYKVKKLKSEERQKEAEAEASEEAEKERQRIEKYKFCYGYTDTKTPLQAGKILKTLNMLGNFNGYKTRKDIIHLIIEGSTNCYIKEVLNTNRYRKGEKLKDKKEIRFYYNGFNSSFLEVTKIESDYINYLLNNKLIA